MKIIFYYTSFNSNAFPHNLIKIKLLCSGFKNPFTIQKNSNSCQLKFAKWLTQVS